MEIQQTVSVKKNSFLTTTLSKLDRGMVKEVELPPVNSSLVFISDDSEYYYAPGDRYLHRILIQS